jgi:hypothetical protein
MKEYIERNALIAELEDDLENDVNMYNSRIDKAIRDDKIDFAIEVLNFAPVADVKEVVHGRWHGKPIFGYATVVCTNCQTGYMSNQGKWKYCPECGAKMDLE